MQQGEFEILDIGDKQLPELTQTLGAPTGMCMSNVYESDPTVDQRMRLIESSGALDFWDRPEEDIY